MRILLIAATEKEIEPFAVNNSAIDLLITGVGVPSTIYKLQKKMHEAAYDLIIQAGIAGSFTHDIPPGKTVLVNQDCFADLGIEEKENFTPIFNTEFADKNEFPFKNGWLINTGKELKDSLLPKVTAITVNKVSDSVQQNQQFSKVFNAGIETMEGAALHYVCLQQDIPFLQIRSISNYTGERDKTKWKLKEAIEYLNTELQALFNKLTDKSNK